MPSPASPPEREISEHERVVRALTAPGAPFEMVELERDGRGLRTWKHAPATLRAVFEASAAFADRPYLVYEDERLSYREVHRLVARFAGALVGRGIGRGDRVAVAMRNYPEAVVALWASACIGAVVVPLNAWWTGEELSYALADCTAAVLVADGERLERLAPYLGSLPLRVVVVCRSGRAEPAAGLGWEAFLATSSASERLPDAELAPEDDATIFYTSGTTGRPKGALGTHRNVCVNVTSTAFGRARALLRAGAPLPDPSVTVPQRSTLLSVPLFHVTGFHSILVPGTAAGSKIVMMRRWDPERALQLIERERVNGFGGVPTVAWQILESPALDRHDTSSIESIGYGGAPAAPELVARLAARFPAAQPGTGYGLTETSSVVTSNAGVDYRQRPGSVGRPVPVCDLRVVDEAGVEVAAGTTGELLVRGPNVIKGYWGRPADTAESFADGWLHTGDLVRIDEDGFVYVLDRVKEMVIRGGENVYCVEVEDVLYAHPSVIDAAVFGIPHRTLGEEVAAAVQIKEGTDVDEEALRRHVAVHLAAFKAPVRIAVHRRTLPRNANGKILKRTLRAELLGEAGAASSDWDPGAAQ